MNRRDCLHAMAISGMAGLARPGVASESRLRIGLTPVILADQVAFLSRWGRYLAAHMDCEVGFIARDSYQGILDLLFSGQIDAAWICGYTFVRYEPELVLFAVPQYLGNPTYQAYLIRSRSSESSIHGWADLKDRVLAYSDPLSNSGWLVAQSELRKAGLTPRDLKRTFFAHGHRNVAEAVAAQLAHAGSIDGYVWETMRRQGMVAATKADVIWKSESYGFPPLVTRRGAPHPYLGQLQKALMSMSIDKVGRELLHALNLSGFVEGAPTLFDSIRRQALLVPGSGVT